MSVSSIGDRFKYDSSIVVVGVLIFSVLSFGTLVTAIQTKSYTMRDFALIYVVLNIIAILAQQYLITRSEDFVVEPVPATSSDIVLGFIFSFSGLFLGTMIGSIIVGIYMGGGFRIFGYSIGDLLSASGIPLYITIDMDTFKDIIFNLLVGYSESGFFHNAIPYYVKTKSNAYIMAIFSNMLFAIMHWYTYQNPYLVAIAFFAGLFSTWSILYLANERPAQQGLNLAHAVWNVMTILMASS